MTAQAKIIALLVMFGLSAFTGWSARGWREGEKYQTMVADIEGQKVRALEKAYAETEYWKRRVSVIDKKYSQENRDAKAKIDDLNRRIRAGTISLSVPTRCPGGMSGTAGDPSLGDGAARAELDPATSENLVAITGDGDGAIRQLNACQDILEAIGK